MPNLRLEGLAPGNQTVNDILPEDYYVVLIFEAIIENGTCYIEIVLVEWLVYPDAEIRKFLESK
jgi:hypothetical protein